MDCKDLMIGDLVYIHEPECKGHRIDSIDELDGQVGADGDVYDECDIRPIPLTEYILGKNGFEFKRHEFKTTNDEYWISDDKRIIFRGEHMTNSFNKWSVHVDTEDMRTMAYLEITYIHQLQHLLRLVGVQKEIEL